MFQGISVYAQPSENETVLIGVNTHNKTYINKEGIMSLSKNDYVIIAGEYEDYYYVKTQTDNIFFIPKTHITNIKEYPINNIPKHINENINTAKKRTQIIAFAYTQIGKPYVWGGAGYRGYDCSSLTQLAYKEIGIDIPRTSKDQHLRSTKKVPKDIKIGDLVFFKSSGTGVNHVGIYMGDDLFIHASNSNKRVVIDSLSSPYFARNIVAVGSYI